MDGVRFRGQCVYTVYMSAFDGMYTSKLVHLRFLRHGFLCLYKQGELLRRKEEPSTETMIMWLNIKSSNRHVVTVQPYEVSAKLL